MAGLVVMTAAARAQSGPDVIGIRLGMAPQDAYNILKARANGAKVGVGQTMLQGVSDKPVAVIMSVKPIGVSPAETVTVWLTFPPNRQQVFAVRRTLMFEQGKEMLKTTVVDSLRQKYGPETDPQFHMWNFDEQGGRIAASEEYRRSGCVHADLLGFSDPVDASAPQPLTPLPNISPKIGQCADVTSVRTEILNASKGNEFVSGVTVTLEDTSLARRTQEAFKTYLANADATKHQEDVDKAKQQKKLSF